MIQSMPADLEISFWFPTPKLDQCNDRCSRPRLGRTRAANQNKQIKCALTNHIRAIFLFYTESQKAWFQWPRCNISGWRATWRCCPNASCWQGQTVLHLREHKTPSSIMNHQKKTLTRRREGERILCSPYPDTNIMHPWVFDAALQRLITSTVADLLIAHCMWKKSGKRQAGCLLIHTLEAYNKFLMRTPGRWCTSNRSSFRAWQVTKKNIMNSVGSERTWWRHVYCVVVRMQSQLYTLLSLWSVNSWCINTWNRILRWGGSIGLFGLLAGLRLMGICFSKNKHRTR